MSLPGGPSPWGPQLTRRPIEFGSIVTDEDPSAWGFGQRGKVLAFLEDTSVVLAIVAYGEHEALRARHEIRDVRDEPPSAQLIAGRLVWDRPE